MEGEFKISDEIMFEIRDNSLFTKALIEDYIKVIAKIEGVSPKDVLQRILDRGNELIAESNEKHNISR